MKKKLGVVPLEPGNSELRVSESRLWINPKSIANGTWAFGIGWIFGRDDRGNFAVDVRPRRGQHDMRTNGPIDLEVTAHVIIGLFEGGLPGPAFLGIRDRTEAEHFARGANAWTN